MKNFNTLLFWVAFFFFIVFFASNALARPQIFFLDTLIWSMWIAYIAVIWMFMWWWLCWMFNKKNGWDYEDSDDWEWF